MYTASCLCNGIQIKINQDISKIFVCHCHQCQKAQGSAFVAITPIETQNLKIIQGKELLGEYFSTALKKRIFCKHCASPIFSARIDLPEIVRLRVGIINEPLTAKVYSHAFTKYKACWFNLSDDDTLKFEEKLLF